MFAECFLKDILKDYSTENKQLEIASVDLSALIKDMSLFNSLISFCVTSAPTQPFHMKAGAEKENIQVSQTLSTT